MKAQRLHCILVSGMGGKTEGDGVAVMILVQNKYKQLYLKAEYYNLDYYILGWPLTQPCGFEQVLCPERPVIFINTGLLYCHLPSYFIKIRHHMYNCSLIWIRFRSLASI